MSTTAEATAEVPADLVERVMALTPAARDRLAVMILDAADGPPDDPEVVRKKNHALVADRIEGLLSGRYETVDAFESLAEIEKWYRETYPK